MDGLIDIHSHILPGVDDGAVNHKTSMKMLEIAWNDGIRQVILTPHNKPMRHNVSLKTLQKLAEDLDIEARHQGMTFTFYMGNEIYYRSDIIEALEEGKACTMARSSYILVEFSPMDDFDYIRKGIYQVLSAGYRPIIAHIERYQCMLNKPEHVASLHKMGCYIQVNAGSVMGQYGFAIKRMTRKLLKQELVSFIASDAHDTEKRAPRLKECAKYISKKFGDEYRQRLFEENPEKLLTDKYI